MLIPGGSAPVVDQVIVPTPLVCVNCSLNALPAVPMVLAGFVTVMVWQVMTSGYVGPLAAHPLPSVKVMTMLNGPDCVGVPERTPVIALSVTPLGSMLAVLKEPTPSPPVCVNCSLYGEP